MITVNFPFYATKATTIMQNPASTAALGIAGATEYACYTQE